MTDSILNGYAIVPCLDALQFMPSFSNRWHVCSYIQRVKSATIKNTSHLQQSQLCNTNYDHFKQILILELQVQWELQTSQEHRNLTLFPLVLRARSVHPTIAQYNYLLQSCNMFCNITVMETCKLVYSTGGRAEHSLLAIPPFRLNRNGFTWS